MQTKANTPARKPRNVKAKPVAKPDAGKPDADAIAAITSRGLARDAVTVARNATNFETSSDRDTAYMLFFGRVMRANNGTATLAQIHAAGAPSSDGKRRSNPHYNGSAKATDAGAINRLRKAGYITVSPDGNTLTATATGKALAAYSGKA